MGWGPAGCGKSIGARALHTEETASILVRVQQRQGTDIGLANLICESGGWRGTPTGRNLIRFITAKLKDTARLLIVDEGHRLRPSGCELLRDLADVAGIPILILATEEFYERVTKVRTGSGNMYFDQFTSRVCLWRDLLRGVDGKGGVTRPIFSIEEVKAIFQDAKVRITTDGMDFLQAVARLVGLGMMRLASNIFDIALRSALRGNKIMDVSNLRRSAKGVLIPVGILDHGILAQIDMTLKHNREIQPKAMQA